MADQRAPTTQMLLRLSFCLWNSSRTGYWSRAGVRGYGSRERASKRVGSDDMYSPELEQMIDRAPARLYIKAGRPRRTGSIKWDENGGRASTCELQSTGDEAIVVYYVFAPPPSSPIDERVEAAPCNTWSAKLLRSVDLSQVVVGLANRMLGLESYTTRYVQGPGTMDIIMSKVQSTTASPS
ncbi:hypothetical protein NUW54_g10141 [Trametes sanguinea]|uniref:Uncharacterized protein n=1 Tax=Trametes sanguinea TaxID=158606 RepID=A0ACC1P486_9APHY|nr:hypothetical protein NUW54_g10141 [Trametes sanguinea]